MSDHFVAVYGSLKKGFYNHDLLASARYIGDYRTEAKYTMLNLEYFPGLLDKGSSEIHVEIYEITQFQLDQLDELEGHPGFFRRDQRYINGFGNAWLYLLGERHGASLDLDDDRVVQNGIWKNRS